MDDRWRLALDVGPVRERPTGVGVYVRSLAAAVAAELPGRVSFIGVRPEVGSNGHLPPAVPRLPFGAGHYQVWLHRRADRDARRSRARLVHYTNGTAPLVSRVPFVLTVQDLSVLRQPQFHPALRVATLPVSLAAIARAAAVIVPSRFTARELHALGVDGRRVTVIGHATERDAAVAAASAQATSARQRLGIEGRPYLLAVGTMEPRKNHRRLFAAFEELAREDPQLMLVLAGPNGWRSAPVYRRLAASPFRERIVDAGYVSAADLDELIAGCLVLCYVSLYEGFGLPIIDAMALGAPVVTSRVSSMPEAAGGAAVLVDPHDVQDIARGIREARRRRSELIAAGRRRTAGRTWRDVAAETVDVYRWVVRRSGGS